MRQRSEDYSLKRASSLAWRSVSLDLDAERTAALNRYVVGPRVLDIGCGGGGFTDYLSRRGLQAAGVERAAELLTIPMQKGLLGQYVRGDALSLPFRDRSFDTTFLFDILEHLDDHAALAEAVRVTRRRVIASVPLTVHPIVKAHGLLYYHYEDQTHLRTYTEASIAELFRKPSLEIVALHQILFLNFRDLLKGLLARRPGLIARGLLRMIDGFLAFQPLPTACIVVAERR